MCQRCFGGCLCTEQMVYSLLNRFGFDVIFHAAKVVLLCDINMDNLSRKNSRIGRFVQFCILYLPKGIKNSPSSEELSEDHRISKLDYFPTSTPITL